MTPQEKQLLDQTVQIVSELKAQVQILNSMLSAIQQEQRDSKVFAAGAASVRQAGGFPSIGEIIPYKMLGIL